MKSKALTAMAVLVVRLLLLPGVSHALTDQQKALVGLKGVYVWVSGIKPEVERLGLTKDQIRIDVELKLRKAGVRVLTKEERFETPGAPSLEVDFANALSPDNPIVACSILVSLQEQVTLDRDFRTYGAIWQVGFVRPILKKNIREIRGDVGDLVDEFVNDYLAANPKK
jgi:hypothetical protein